MLIDIVQQVSQILGTLCVVVSTRLTDQRLEVVLLEPRGEEGEVGGAGLRAGLVGAGEVDVEILVDVDGGVVERVADHVDVVGGGGVAGAGGLVPGVAACVAVAGREDELFGA